MTVGGKDRIAVHTVKGVIGGIKGNASADLQLTVVIDNGAGIAASVHAHVQRARAANSQAAAVVNEAVKQIVDIRHADIDIRVNGQVFRCVFRNRDGTAACLEILLLFQGVEVLIGTVIKVVDQDALNRRMLQRILQLFIAAADHRIADGACACGEAFMEYGNQNQAFTCIKANAFCFGVAFARLVADSPFYKLIALIRQGGNSYFCSVGDFKRVSDIGIIR